MFFAPNPGILAAGVSTGKTYAEFVAHITSLAVDGGREWTSSVVWPTGGAALVATCAAETGLLTGSPWSARFRGGNGHSATSGVAQHCFFSAAIADENKSSGRKVFIRVSAVETSPDGFAALDRNGLLSSASGFTTNAFRVTEFLLFSNAIGPVRMQPSLGLGPTPYDW